MQNNTTEQDKFSAKFEQEFTEFKKEISKVSILVMGGSGTGKSTLVNSVFKKKIAESGAGRPTTKGIQEYNNSYLIVYDSEGYESGAENQQRYSELIYNFLQCKNENPLTAVHLGWYCLSAPSARFTELDAELVKKTSKFMPLAVVLTKIDLATEEQVAALTKAIKEQCPAISIFLSTTENIPLENDLNTL